jgi:moderate conductance mechanosensitive channel
VYAGWQEIQDRILTELPETAISVAASLFRIALISGMLWLALRTLQVASERAVDGRFLTIRTLIRSVLRYAAIGIAAVMILEELGVKPSALIASIGVIGIIVGLGTQTLIRDIIGGLSIVMEDQFRVGDTVTIGAFTGTVTELGLRATRLVDDGGNVHIVPNGDIRSVTIKAKADVRVTVDLAFPAARKLEEARTLVARVGRRFGATVDGPVALTQENYTLRLEARVPPKDAVRTENGMREALQLELEQARAQEAASGEL